jgi:hypothetical protein
MFYLTTYATHDERYFKFIKNRVHKVLGFGKKWNGFHDKVKAVIEFCESVEPDDIVCFVDGFDSMILGTDQEILAAYKALGQELVFSKEKTILDSKADMYVFKKNFGECIKNRLNSGLYIGRAQSISDFWRDMKPGQDDQRYACAKGPYVDLENKLFYNFSKLDTDVTRDADGFIYKGSQKVLIIGMPANETIRSDVIAQPKYFRLLKAYWKNWIPEILLVCVLIYVIYTRWSRSS